MRTVCHAAYRTSIALAEERGVFPEYRATEYLAGDFIMTLPEDIQESIRQGGIRNSHLIAIAPAGSISLLANNVSSGIEPIFAFQADRKIKVSDGSVKMMPVNDYAWSLFHELRGDAARPPDYFVEAYAVEPIAQLKLQSCLQEHVDQSISKTINLPNGASFDHCRDVFMQAYRLGLKGCTVFRPNPISGAVLSQSSGASKKSCS